MVIAVIAYQTLNQQRIEKLSHLQAQGQSLAQLISEVPAEQLTEKNHTQCPKYFERESLPRMISLMPP